MLRKTTFLMLLACAACGSSPTPVAAPARTEPKVAATATAEKPPAEDESDEEQEPKVASKTFAELQKAALACVMEDDGTFESNCEGFEAWLAEQPAFDEGRANPQLLEMLVSKDLKTRILAAERLRMTFHEENLDGKHADMLLAAAEAEREEGAIKPMVAMVTGQNLVKVGKVERAVAIGKAHPNADFRETMLIHIGFFNRDKAVLAWAREASTDKNHRMRNAALRAASYHTEMLPDEACKLVNGFRTDKDSFVKSSARSLLAESRKCVSFFGKLLDDLGTVTLNKGTPGKFGVHFSYGYALTSLCRNPALDAKLRERTIKAAKRLVEATDIGAGVRQSSLEAVGLCDAKGAKEYAVKFKSDKDLAATAGKMSQ